MCNVRCDIFCRVIDNYGDIGVCWRLARQLAAEQHYAVDLWVDDLAAFARLCPAVVPTLPTQTLDGVTIRHWCSPFAARDGAAAQLVIEAFACALPDAYVQAMATRLPPPAWINLEYLSAEPWVASHHGLPSPHPRLPLTKYFFFPGFSAGTGGLLREADLLDRRRRAAPHRAWAELELPAPLQGQTQVSLFCYDNPALAPLLQAWSQHAAPLRCLVTPGAAQQQVAAWLDRPQFTVGDQAQRGPLTLYALPFLAQPRYDQLLWACDLNLVRGEDSFVRAQWAARPLLWQAYPQAEQAQRLKVEAFVDVYCAGLPTGASAAWRQLMVVWNENSDAAPASAASLAVTWQACWEQRQVLAAHANTWAEELASTEDLVTRLVKFIEPLI